MFLDNGSNKEQESEIIQVVRNAATSRTFKLKIKTRKLMHAVTKSVLPFKIQTNMLHFFLIKVVKDCSALEEKLKVNM
jgi:hypothetical protein